MDKRKGALNVSVSIGFKIATMIMVIVVKKYLIQFCGNEVNGLNALYLSIIGFLSVAELGIGSAITFCMYKPIVEKDDNKVAALYRLFNKIYFIVGGIILAAGLGLTPFIAFFAKDYEQLDVNLYSTFVLMLISVVITYFYGAKTALINAHKNNYITTIIFSGGVLFQYALQIFVLLLIKSFEWYLICRIISAVLQGVATEIVANKKYRQIILNEQKIDEPTKKGLIKSIKAMFMHKVGLLMVNTADSMIISIFVGVVSLGEYSNYTAIMVSVTNIIALVFSSLTSVLGHLYVEADKKITQKYCEAFHLLNFILGTVFYLGYYAIVDNLIAVLFSPNLIIDKSISFVIALNGFVMFLRRNVLAFRDATGTFYNDRWKPLIEGIVNIFLSIWFINLFGIVGVIIATIITNLVICHIIEPYVLYKNAFSASPKKYYFVNYGMIILFFITLSVFDSAMKTFDNVWKELFVNGFMSVGFSAFICSVVILLNWNNYRDTLKKIVIKEKI